MTYVSQNAKISIYNAKFSGGEVIFSRILYRIITLCYHCDLPYNINYDKVHLCHAGFGIVINRNVTIGDGTYIQHCVTIGARDDIKSKLAPKIRQNCYIGARALIIGDVKIGAGAVVVKDVPSNYTAVGVPARIIQRQES